MREFKINENLRPYIEKVLERRDINYINRPGVIIVELTGNQFHKVITRAKCERLNEVKNLDYRHTYYVSKIENQTKIQSENPEWEFFLDYPFEDPDTIY